MGWTKDTEARTIIAQKAQDAYSAARQALARIDGLEAQVNQLSTDLMESRAFGAALSRRVDKLAAAFEAATEPQPRRTRVEPRKAA